MYQSYWSRAKIPFWLFQAEVSFLELALDVFGLCHILYRLLSKRHDRVVRALHKVKGYFHTRNKTELHFLEIEPEGCVSRYS